MAADHVTMNLTRWNAALANRDAGEAARAALADHPQSHVRNEVFALAAEAEDRLFRIPAPTLGALRGKLEAFWTDIWDETEVADVKRRIIGDTTRIELLLAGVDPEEASGGMDLKKVASHFAEAEREYDHYVELQREGPSDNWGQSTVSDIVAFRDEAESMMLSLPAPNLAGVLKKLSAMWEDDRYDAIEATTAHVTILRDLRRLAETQN